MKIIELTKGMRCMVDDADYEMLCSYKWGAIVAGRGKHAYARTTINYRGVLMHRLLMGVTDRRVVVDHIDGNGLNNQRANLRTATVQQNRWNLTAASRSGSGYYGVSKFGNAWIAKDGINYIGSFPSAIVAAAAYNAAISKSRGEFATINAIESANEAKYG